MPKFALAFALSISLLVSRLTVAQYYTITRPDGVAIYDTEWWPLCPAVSDPASRSSFYDCFDANTKDTVENCPNVDSMDSCICEFYTRLAETCFPGVCPGEAVGTIQTSMFNERNCGGPATVTATDTTDAGTSFPAPTNSATVEPTNTDDWLTRDSEKWWTLCPTALNMVSWSAYESCYQSNYQAVYGNCPNSDDPGSSCFCEWHTRLAETCLPGVCPDEAVTSMLNGGNCGSVDNSVDPPNTTPRETGSVTEGAQGTVTVTAAVREVVVPVIGVAVAAVFGVLAVLL